MDYFLKIGNCFVSLLTACPALSFLKEAVTFLFHASEFVRLQWKKVFLIWLVLNNPDQKLCIFRGSRKNDRSAITRLT